MKIMYLSLACSITVMPIGQYSFRLWPEKIYTAGSGNNRVADLGKVMRIDAECPIINGTAMLPFPRLREQCRRGSGRNGRARGRVEC